jgi:hypothetical protein
MKMGRGRSDVGCGADGRRQDAQGGGEAEDRDRMHLVEAKGSSEWE